MAPGSSELGGQHGQGGKSDLIAKGIAASAGTYTGAVRVVLDVEDLPALKEGEVLVVRASNPVWTVGMLRSGAIIAELGGPICHAAIVAREIGIPCVVAVGNATGALRTGMHVTVDGTKGLVFGGGVAQHSGPTEN